MGLFDCYCSFCGGPLYYAAVQFGSTSTKALARRKRRLEKAKRRRAGETDLPDSNDEASDREGGGEEEEEYDAWEQDHCYNPELVSEDSTEWVGNCRCLGFNADAPGISKAFISGRGSCPTNGEFAVSEPPGDDPNDPGEESYSCYDSEEETIAFPFHESCFKVLCRSLFGHENVIKIDKDILYSVLSQLNGVGISRGLRQLNVDYGGIEGMEQTWDCISGEEYSVLDPKIDPEVAATLRIELSRRAFDKLPAKLDLGSKVRNDPFTKLSHDVLSLIFPYLPHEAVLAFRQASWYVFNSTCGSSFWRGMIRREILPWFWELEPNLVLDTIDAKGLYLWLDKVTTPRFDMEGPFMGIANRRRIWHVCEEVKKVYIERAIQDAKPNDQDDEDARAIMEKSTSLQMPIVLYPQLEESVTIPQQWIRSWDELHNPSKALESFWHPTGSLVGLGVKFGSDRRIFGQGESEELGITIRSVPIPANEWIRDIVLYLSNINLLYLSASTVSIKGLSITLTSGKTLNVVYAEPGLNQRVLAITPGMHLTGLVGQFSNPDADNTGPSRIPLISRLQILQCAAQSGPESTLPFAQRLLWKESAAKLASHGAMFAGTAPIWSHPHIRMIPFSLPSTNTEEIPLDILPHEILVWAKEESELKHLTRISAFVVEMEVLGLRAEYEKRYWEPRRSIGMGPGGTRSTDWRDEHLVHFDIDGPGGEIITEIFVEEDSKAVKLHTNWGRDGYFGEIEGRNWDVVRPGEREAFVGMVVCFGTRSGWDCETEMYSHVKITTATGLVMSVKD